MKSCSPMTSVGYFFQKKRCLLSCPKEKRDGSFDVIYGLVADAGVVHPLGRAFVMALLRFFSSKEPSLFYLQRTVPFLSL